MPDCYDRDEGHDRERLALYLTGLLPDDPTEARAVLDLCGSLVLLVAESRASQGRRDLDG